MYSLKKAPFLISLPDSLFHVFICVKVHHMSALHFHYFCMHSCKNVCLIFTCSCGFSFLFLLYKVLHSSIMQSTKKNVQITLKSGDCYACIWYNRISIRSDSCVCIRILLFPKRFHLNVKFAMPFHKGGLTKTVRRLHIK